MKLRKRIICCMLVFAMLLCNNAVITFAESCNGTGTETEGDFIYDKRGNEISITKYTGSDANVMIPEELEDCPVVSISYNVFKDDDKIETIVMPDTIREIGAEAFANCTNLTDIVLSDKLQIIDAKAFQNCSQLQTIDLPEGLIITGSDVFSGSALTEITFPRTFKDGRNVLRGSSVEKVTFADGTTKVPDFICSSARCIKAVELPETVTEIGTCAFDGCFSLETITLPEKLSSIGGYCFRNSGITSIKIPSALTEGAGAFQDSGLVTAVLSSGMENIPDSLFQSAKKLEAVSIPDSVKMIGAYAFTNDESLTDVTLPENLTVIRENAFLNCSKLERLDIPSGVTRLGNNILRNTAVKEIMIPNTVTYANSAFGESAIEKAVIEPGMTKLPNGIFANTKSLSEIVLPDTLTEIEPSVFYNSSLSKIRLPAGVTAIGNNAFKNCSNLTELSLPDGVTTLGYGFLEGSGVTDITVPATVTKAVRAFQGSMIKHADVVSGMTKLPDSIFYGAGKLAQVQLPDSITEIGQEAFYNNTELADISLPDSLVSVGVRAFGRCGKMDAIILPSGVRQLGREFMAGTKVASIRVPAAVTSADSAFYGSSIEEAVLEDGMKSVPSGIFDGAPALSDITLADTTEEIGSKAFYECSKLEELTIPESVTTIGSEFIKGTGITFIRLNAKITSANGMLSGSSVTTVEFPSNMTEIPDGMFRDAAELTRLVIPEGVTRIGSSAFYNCKSLTEMKIPNSVENIGSYAFYGTGITEIDIPLSVTRMNSAFNGSSIEKVNVDKNISAIPNGAFRGASRLTDIILPEG